MGLNPIIPSFLQELRDLTLQKNIVLIFDEVVTGFRISKGGAQSHYGITPDMTTLAKILGGGLPGGAVAGKAEIINMIEPSGDPEWDRNRRIADNGTFNANPITMLAGSVTLEQLTPTVFASLSKTTEYLKQGILEVCSKQELPVQVTGLGSLFGIHFTDTNIGNYRDCLLYTSDAADE